MERPAPSEWKEENGYNKQTLVPRELLEGDDACLEVIEVPPDEEVDPHHHERTEEVLFVLQDGGTLVINGSAFTPEQGEVIVCEPEDSRAVINDGDVTFRLLVVKHNSPDDDMVWEEGA